MNNHDYIIDCDIHPTFGKHDYARLAQRYLPKAWQAYAIEYGQNVVSHSIGSHFPRIHPNSARFDAWPPNGDVPGSDYDFMKLQHFDRWKTKYCIINPLTLLVHPRNYGFANAVAHALNEWVIETWLAKDDHLRSSISIAYEDPTASVREIERYSGDPRFVSICFVTRTFEPLGNSKYWPIYEICESKGLPFGIHFGGYSGWPLTGAGFPSYYIEDHCGMAQSMQAHVISMVMEGVFERFPKLQVVLLEGGMMWLPSLMWRLDRCWRAMRSEVPHLKEPPSFYIRRNVWLTTQPIEEPKKLSSWKTFVEQLNMPGRIMYASDYPHWDFDSPEKIEEIFTVVGRDFARDILGANAERLYRFEAGKPLRTGTEAVVQS